MSHPKVSDAGERVAVHGEWSGWVKKGNKGRWRWTLKRGDDSFGYSSLSGFKEREAAVEAVILLVSGMAAKDSAAEKDAALETAQTAASEAHKEAHEANSRVESMRRQLSDAGKESAQTARDVAKRAGRARLLFFTLAAVMFALGWVLAIYA